MELISISSGIRYSIDHNAFYCEAGLNNEITSLEIVKKYIAENKISGYRTFNYGNMKVVGYFVDGILDGFVVKYEYSNRTYHIINEQLYHKGILIRGKYMKYDQIEYYETNVFNGNAHFHIDNYVNNNIMSSYSLNEDREYVVSNYITLISKWYNIVRTKTYDRHIDNSGKIIYTNNVRKCTYNVDDSTVSVTIRDMDESISNNINGIVMSAT